eukprot:scaffold5511_cov460-Prasinococcus_capsulatus_cf.AAC.1
MRRPGMEEHYGAGRGCRSSRARSTALGPRRPRASPALGRLRCGTPCRILPVAATGRSCMSEQCRSLEYSHVYPTRCRSTSSELVAVYSCPHTIHK